MSAPLRRLVLPAVVLALSLTACTGTSTPTATVTVTEAPRSSASSGDPSAPTATTTTAAESSNAQVQSFIDALDAFVAYVRAWPGGDLGDDPQFRQLKSAFVDAKRAINRTDLWLGENSAVTAPGMSISAGQAVTIGQGSVRANATAVDVDLDNDDARLTWEIEFSNGDDVTIDADTGTVLDVDIDD